METVIEQAEPPYSKAMVEVLKASCRAQIERHAQKLAMLEILESAGGELTALELIKRLITHFNDLEKDPLELCVMIGFHPDEMISLRGML